MRVNAGSFQNLAHLHLKVWVDGNDFHEAMTSNTAYKTLVDHRATGSVGQTAVTQIRDEPWKMIDQLPTDVITRLIFDTIDSDGNGELSRKEVRLSVFGDSIAQYWSKLDVNSDQLIDMSECAPTPPHPTNCHNQPPHRPQRRAEALGQVGDFLRLRRRAAWRRLPRVYDPPRLGRGRRRKRRHSRAAGEGPGAQMAAAPVPRRLLRRGANPEAPTLARLH
jgi:hypothetical protein